MDYSVINNGVMALNSKSEVPVKTRFVHGRWHFALHEHLALMSNWYDPRLEWNASDYSNISEIGINWAWRPEFYIGNSAKEFTGFGYDNGNTRFHVFNTGIVRWIAPLHVTTSCDVSIVRFPFDSQTCMVELVFIEVNGVDVVLNISSEINVQLYFENDEWQYKGSHALSVTHQACCPASGLTVSILKLSFTRLRPFYVMNLLIPAVLLSLCMVLTFLLPSECGERLGFSLTILLSYTVLLTITSDMMPTTSKETSHINTYLLNLLILCSLSVLNVVGSVKMFYLETKPPKWLQKIAVKIKPFVFLRCCKSSDKVRPADFDVQLEDIENYNKTAYKNDKNGFVDVIDETETTTWKGISEIIDRICFYLYTTACLVILFAFMLALTSAI